MKKRTLTNLQTSASGFIEVDLVGDIVKKCKIRQNADDMIVVPQPHQRLFSQDFNLSMWTAPNKPKQQKSEEIRPNKLTKLVSDMITQQACPQLRNIYHSIKSLKKEEKFDKSRLKTDSSFANPRGLKKDIEVLAGYSQKLSKVKRHYRKEYLSALEKKANEYGEKKPLQSKLCVSNFLYSQISVAALAGRKFNSVKARRRLEVVPTKTTDEKMYPESPRQQHAQKSHSSSKLAPKKRHSRKLSVQNDYRQTFLLDSHNPLDQYLKHYVTLEQKWKRVYNSSMQEIESLVRLAKQQGLEKINFYEEIVGKEKTKKQMK